MNKCLFDTKQVHSKSFSLFYIALTFFKHIHFTSIEKQVLTIYTNLSRFCFLGFKPVLTPNMWANENPKIDTHSRESNTGP